MIRKTLFALALLFAASAQAQKVSALTEITSGHATGDLVSLVDVSDTTMAATGTNKKSTLTNLFANIPGPTNAVAMSVTGQSLTGSNASTLLNLAGTWNTSGTPTAVKLNVTDTASAASSLLMDLQVGGSPQFRVHKSGQKISLGTDSGGDRGSIRAASYSMYFDVAGVSAIASISDTGLFTTKALAMTGQSLTGSSATSLANLATAWNTSGTPTAVKLNVTDTASNASSLLMDLQVGGTSKVSFRKDGSIWPGGLATANVGLIPHTNTDTILGVPSNNFFRLSPYSSGWSSGGGTMVLSANGGVGWASVGGASNSGDTFISRHAAGVVRINDASNNTRGFLGGGASVASASALPAPTGRVFHVTGTTTITSITSTNFQSGVCITLIFDGALTFTDGSNLKLAGDFVTTADDTINLCYDGTSWFETSRSVN